MHQRVGDAADGLVGFGLDDRRIDVEGDVDVEGRQLLQVRRDRRPLAGRRLALAAHLRALGDLLAQRGDVELEVGLVFVELRHDVVAGRRGLRKSRRGRQQEDAAREQADGAQDTHQRYPASVKAWLQLRLTPLAVIRHGTDLLVSLVEPWQILTISRVQALATVTRAAIRFWMASKTCR